MIDLPFRSLYNIRKFSFLPIKNNFIPPYSLSKPSSWGADLSVFRKRPVLSSLWIKHWVVLLLTEKASFRVQVRSVPLSFEGGLTSINSSYGIISRLWQFMFWDIFGVKNNFWERLSGDPGRRSSAREVLSPFPVRCLWRGKALPISFITNHHWKAPRGESKLNKNKERHQSIIVGSAASQSAHHKPRLQK